MSEVNKEGYENYINAAPPIIHIHIIILPVIR